RATALVYYWVIAALYLVTPRSAYRFMEIVEGHAYATYDKFLKAEADTLKAQPAPAVAVQYYRDGDLYMFDEFQTTHVVEARRPTVDN
ncbi:alternative oxidase, partial [Haemophilus parainfluenzae]|uniref:alternative oxidase n=1 Tax=Haemophilus parainfluenzae TaxID=729 RepID=UPI00157F43EF